MIELVHLLPSGGWQRIVADAIWQSTLVGSAALLIARFYCRRPAIRAAVTLVAAGLCVVAPLVTFAVRSAGWGLLTEPAAVSQSLRPAKVAAAAAAPRSRPHNPAIQKVAALQAAVGTDVEYIAVAGSSALPTAKPQYSYWHWFAAFWLGLSGCLALGLLRSALAIRRTVHSATVYRDVDVHAALLRAAGALGVEPPELLESRAINSPALVIWGRPRLLLPAKKVPRTDWFVVFCHELAHLARCDGFTRLMYEMFLLALPWQPAMWLLRREFRSACEEACDDWAVAAGADPVEFASLLADFIPQSRPALVLGMAESVQAARRRILRLLSMQGLPRPRLGWLAGVAGWLFALALLIALAFMQHGSRQRGSGQDLPPWGDAPASAAAARVVLPAQPTPLKEYRIEPPDILLIETVKLVPKSPYHIEPLDVVHLTASGKLPEIVNGEYPVDPSGDVDLGPIYKKVHVGGLTTDEAQELILKQLRKFASVVDLSVGLARTSGLQNITDEHLVGPDGMVNLGTYGSVFVAGMTIGEAKSAIEKQLSAYLEQPRVSVSVYAYNSTVYYVITEKAGQGDTVVRVPITGNSTVLDALAQLSGQKVALGNCWAWIVRTQAGDGKSQILPIDWQAIVDGRETITNWQILPGDRVYIREKR